MIKDTKLTLEDLEDPSYTPTTKRAFQAVSALMECYKETLETLEIPYVVSNQDQIIYVKTEQIEPIRKIKTTADRLVYEGNEYGCLDLEFASDYLRLQNFFAYFRSRPPKKYSFVLVFNGICFNVAADIINENIDCLNGKLLAAIWLNCKTCPKLHKAAQELHIERLEGSLNEAEEKRKKAEANEVEEELKHLRELLGRKVQKEEIKGQQISPFGLQKEKKQHKPPLPNAKFNS